MKTRLVTLGVLMLTSSGGAWLAACDGPVLWSDPADAGKEPIDGSHLVDASPHDATSPTTDANPPIDAGLDCASVAWPLMLAAPIVPLQSWANLNLNAGGPATVSLAYAESVNCLPNPFDGGGPTGSVPAAWGPNNDVSFEYDTTAPNLFFEMDLTQGYTGTVTFHSRAGGVYGDHQYEIGINKLLRDGQPYTIDWTGTSPVIVTSACIHSVAELYDGIMATFAPTYPESDDACAQADDCYIDPNNLVAENDAGSPNAAIVGFRPLKFYFEMPVGTSSPNDFYTFFTGGPDLYATPTDGGPFPGMDAGGGVGAPADCLNGSGDEWGSCAHPTHPLCADPNAHPYSCRDYPQSGYLATCCPADGG